MLLRIMALMWFIVRSMASLPPTASATAILPRMDRPLSSEANHRRIGLPAWRPLSPVLAPFFFCVYLQDGHSSARHQLAGIDWPDIDWPDIECPSQLPRVSLPDLGMLLLRLTSTGCLSRGQPTRPLPLPIAHPKRRSRRAQVRYHR